MSEMNSVAYVDGAPKYELTATELVFQMNAVAPFILAHMHPYTSGAMKAAAAALKSTRRWEDQNVVVFEAASLAGLQGIFDQCFIRLSNVAKKNGEDLSIAEQQQWLAKTPAFKERVVNQGMTGIRRGVKPVADPDQVTATLDLDSEGGEAEQIYKLYDTDTKAQVEIEITHQFIQCSEADRNAYRIASTSKMDSKRSASYTDVNYDSIEVLYDKLVTAADGFLIAGEACTSENKSRWTPKIPFWMKKHAVETYFEQVERKND